jgi:hypothetical protein
MPRGNCKTSRNVVNASERRIAAMELRLSGATFEKIAAAMHVQFPGRLPKNYDKRQAWQDVNRELEKLTARRVKAAEQLLQLELERLNKLQVKLWVRAQDGDLKAMDRLLKIIERRSRLLGLDAPVKADVTSKGEPITMVEIVIPNE